MNIPDAVLEAADEFIAQLRRRQIEGSLPCAKRTAEILRLLITKSRHPTAEALLDDPDGWRVKHGEAIDRLKRESQRPAQQIAALLR